MRYPQLSWDRLRGTSISRPTYLASKGTENQLKYWIKKARKLSEDLGQTWAQVEISDIDPLAQCALSSSSIIVGVGSARIEVRPGFDPSLLSEILRVVAATC